MNTIEVLLAELATHGSLKKYKAKQAFIQEGSIPKKIGVVKKGLFRYYYLSEDGREFIKGFMKEGAILSSYSSMIAREKSFYTIEAIEESEVAEVSYLQWQKLREKDAKWNELLIALLEKGYTNKEKREREFLLLNAESRYKSFQEEYPTLEQRLKQYMIASYIGITPIALSRIRGNK